MSARARRICPRRIQSLCSVLFRRVRGFRAQRHGALLPRLSIHVLCLLVAGAVALPAQEPDVVRGRVFGPDSVALDGALVTAASPDRSKTTRTDSRGSFTLIFDSGTDDYLVTVTSIGMAPARVRAVRQPGQIGIPALTIYMSPAAQQLRGVAVSAQRPRPPRSETQSSVGAATLQTDINTSDPLLGDLSGNLASVLAFVPGISLLPNPGGGAPGGTALGTGVNGFATTLGGMAIDASMIPRDAVGVRVSTANFDPSTAGAAGPGISLTFRGGGNTAHQLFHVSRDDPHLQWVDPTFAGTSGKHTGTLVSGVASGPITRDRAFYNLSGQFGRTTSALSTLSSTGNDRLTALGLQPDSIVRLLALADGLGLPTQIESAARSRGTTTASGVARIDLSSEGGTNTSVTALAALSESDGLGLSASAVPGYGARTQTGSAQVQAKVSRYFLGSLLSEGNLAVATGASDVRPYLRLPAALVQIPTALDGGAVTQGLAVLGGNVAGIANTRTMSVEGKHDLSWYSLNGRHRLRLTVDGRFIRSSQSSDPNGLGQFTFSSLNDFAEGHASAFTRTVTPMLKADHQVSGFVGIGDLYQPTPRVQVQYGFQVLGSVLPSTIPYNAVLASSFGVRNDRVPQSAVWNPMAGFNWRPAWGSGEPDRGNNRVGVFSGGVSRGGAPLGNQLVSAIAASSGLPGGTAELSCVGAATPTPDWRAYEATPAAVPAFCADGSSASVATIAVPAATFFGPAYKTPELWHGHLAWQGILWSHLSAALTTVYTLGDRLTSRHDLNLVDVPQFLLSDERGRPVFVSSSEIVPQSALIPQSASRRFGQFATVTELNSEGRSEGRQIMASVTPFLPRRYPIFLTASYSYQQLRERKTGIDGTTGGDPNTIEWQRADGDARHQFTISGGFSISRLVQANIVGRFQSGFPYTPRVDADVNGDGYVNDRAFVFGPQSNNRDLGAAIGHLIATSDPARRCLAKQLDAIAAHNSCQAPWSSIFGMSISPNAERLHLPARSSLSLSVSNMPAALDRLLHGSATRGWGGYHGVDPVLLHADGFDPATRRYEYTVNPYFGTTGAARATTSQPFSIRLDFQWRFEPDPVRLAVSTLLRPDAADSTTRLSAEQIKDRLLRLSRNEVDGVLAVSDSLHLTRQQIEDLGTIRRRINDLRDTTYGTLANGLAALNGEVGSRAVSLFQNANDSFRETLPQLLDAVRAVLTSEQRGKLPPLIAASLVYRPAER